MAAVSSEQTSREVLRDLRTLARFVQVYCRGRHRGAVRGPIELKVGGAAARIARGVTLCPSCGRLLSHAFVKRMWCPMDPKPACKHCPQHCYHPKYRRQIREVMKYSGWRLLLSGRVDYLLHLLT